MTDAANPRLLTRYKAWANEVTFATLRTLPVEELTRPRATRFGSILHTLNHVYVIDVIFQAHLEGDRHGYTARNTERPPPFAELEHKVSIMDRWYVDYADRLTAPDETVEFPFVEEGRGSMTRAEMVLHIVNHGSYHRGFVGDMLYHIPAAFPANDLTVFLRDHRPDLSPASDFAIPVAAKGFG